MGRLDGVLHLGKQYTEVFACFSMIKYPPQRESVLLGVWPKMNVRFVFRFT